MNPHGSQPRPAKRVRVLGPAVQDSPQPDQNLFEEYDVIDLTVETPLDCGDVLGSIPTVEHTGSLCCYGVVSTFF